MAAYRAFSNREVSDPAREVFERNLTGLQQITLDYIPAPAPLQPFLTTLYYFRSDEREIRDLQPASVGSLLIFLRGRGRMHFTGGQIDPSHPESLITPTSAAVPFEVDGPFHCVGCSLSPLGWAALTGEPANAHGDRMLDARGWLGQEVRELGDDLRAAYAEGTASPAELCERIAAFLGTRLGRVNPRHVELMKQITEWLSSSFDPSLADLLGRVAYSERQLQRLVERYYGISPKQLVRKYRALRVAALLQDPRTSDEKVAELLNLFYDQSHLIREIRLFAGRTPARLGDAENPILDALLDSRNFREITPNVARLPGD